ncbi:pyridoxine 5'-phosphate synthase [Lichenicoccus sp.]|uniref:pyridoxine 5'-phosphate synthase n=1 Tax=Lichenicoccus sp. TaxID=2781899 RepID=UPI003D0F13E0
MTCRLGVNIDHVATVRNARGGGHPDPLEAARVAIAAGADGITLHLREDRRHIRDDDLQRIASGIDAPVNLEMAATSEMADIAAALHPHACCIVPERRTEVTTEGGLDAAGGMQTLAPIVARLSAAGIRVSLFIDADAAQIKAAATMRAAVVELHTGAYAHHPGEELQRLRDGARLADSLGLEVHAGHGLTFDNVGPVAAIPEIRELNIGHFLIGEAILHGLPHVVRHMKGLIAAARS